MIQLIKIAIGIALLLIFVKVAFDWIEARRKKKLR